MKKLKLTIDGMHCASCAQNIERSMKKVKGTHDISVSAVTKKCFVELDDSVKEDDLKAAVKRAGYSVTSIDVV